ncbi:MAG: hypothetical protein Q4F05_15045 [bacterium]|nr:hypothetical protein [bacterium]
MTEILRTLNATPQAGTTTASFIDLGMQICAEGAAITYLAPNTIYFNAPGTYFVRYSGQFIGTNTTDSVFIQAVLGGTPVVGSSLNVTFPVAGIAQTGTQSFYVTVTSPTTLTFAQTSTLTTDTISNFGVVVTRINTPYMDYGCNDFYY